MAKSDDFNRGNGGLGSNWTTADGSAPTILSNAVRGNDVAYSAAFWSADSWNDDHDSEVVRGSTNYAGPAVRVDAASGGNYYWWHSAAELHKVVAGSPTSLGVIGATASGDTMRLDVSGTTLELFKNTVSQGTKTDSAITSGSSGLAHYGTSSTGTNDDWVGTGEVAAGGGGGEMSLITGWWGPTIS